MSDRMKVTFLNLNNNPDTSVEATFGVHIYSMDQYLSKCKLIKKKDGSFFIAPPSEEHKNPETGQKEYTNYFWFGKKTDSFFQSECKKAIAAYCKEKGLKNPMGE